MDSSETYSDNNDRVENLQQQAWNNASLVEQQGTTRLYLVWIFFGLMAFVAGGGVISVLNDDEASDSRGVVIVASLVGLAFIYILCVIADLYANRSRLHGLQGKMEAVNFDDDSDD